MSRTRPEATPRLADPARCSLCGGANDCAQAAGTSTSAAPCWCVERRFPPGLLERASARDGGAACVCRRCLDAAEAAEATEAVLATGAPPKPAA